jgi:hypothetical protein
MGIVCPCNTAAALLTTPMRLRVRNRRAGGRRARILEDAYPDSASRGRVPLGEQALAERADEFLAPTA